MKNNQKGLISIIVPCFNSGKTLKTNGTALEWSAPLTGLLPPPVPENKGKIVTVNAAGDDLEYGANSLSIQEDSLVGFQKIAIIDDLLATGGTVNCVAEILESMGKDITGLSVVIELEALEGRSKFDFDISSEMKF